MAAKRRQGRGPGTAGQAPVALGEGELVTSTSKAVLVRLGGRTEWLPRSALHPQSEVPERRSGRVVVWAWLARARGWML